MFLFYQESIRDYHAQVVWGKKEVEDVISLDYMFDAFKEEQTSFWGHLHMLARLEKWPSILKAGMYRFSEP